MHKLPEVNKIYRCFDDGKISEYRMYKISIKEIISFCDANEEIIKMWQEAISDCSWLYRQATDFFVIGYNEDHKKEIFARTVDGEWFGINGFLSCGLLDVSGDLTKRLTKMEYGYE